MNKFRTFLVILVFAVILSVVWLSVKIYRDGFYRDWVAKVENDFASKGVFVRIKKITLNPLRGIVAQNVSIYQSKVRKVDVAYVDRIVLDVDYTKLFRKREILRSVELKDSVVALPWNGGDLTTIKANSGNTGANKTLRFKNLNARVIFPLGKIEVLKADFVFNGLEIRCNGTFLSKEKNNDVGGGVVSSNRGSKNGQSEVSGAERNLLKESLVLHKKWVVLLEKLARELQKFDFSAGDLPVLNILMQGDLAKPEEISFKLDFLARNFSLYGYEIHKVKASADVCNREFSVNNLVVEDKFGKLFGKFNFTKAGKLKFEVNSNSAVHAFLSKILPLPILGEIVFYEHPHINLAGELDLKQKFSADSLPISSIGSFRCGKFASRGVVFKKLTFGFAINRENIYIRNLSLWHDSGTVDFAGFKDSDGIIFKTTVKANPIVFKPFIKPESGLSRFLETLQFSSEPDFSAEITGTNDTLNFKKFDIKGNTLCADDFYYKGISFQRFESDFQIKEGKLILQNLKALREEGNINIDYIFNDKHKKFTEIKNAKGVIDPVEFFQIFSPKISEHLEQYNFGNAPYLTVNGAIDRDNREKMDITISVSSLSEADLILDGKVFPLRDCSGTLQFARDEFRILNLKADFFDGNLKANILFPDFYRDEKNILSNIRISRSNLDKILKVHNYTGKTGGKFDLNLEFETGIANLRTLNGKGNLRVYDGVFYEVPFLGPLSFIINNTIRFIPKLGYSIFREAAADFIIKNGVISTENFTAKATGLRIIGNGNIDIVDNLKMKFDARVNLSGIPGIPLNVISKLFEFTSTDTLSNPKWRYKPLRIFSN